MEVTASGLVSYVLGIAALVSSGVGLVLQPLAGAALLIGGVFCLPPTRRAIAEAVDLRFSSAATTIVAALLLVAGVGGVAVGQFTESPDVQGEYEWEVVNAATAEPMVIVTGDIENRGDAGADDVTIVASVVSDDGTTITERRKTLDTLSAGTSQMMYYEFDVSQRQAANIQTVNLTIRAA